MRYTSFLLFNLVNYGIAITKQPNRSITIQNDAKARIELSWIDPSSGDRTVMSDPYIIPGSEYTLNSFVSHQFEVKELPSKNTGKCSGGVSSCQISFFTVNEHENQVFVVNSDYEIEHVDHTTNARKDASQIAENCNKQASEDMISGVPSEKILDRMAECLAQQSAHRILDATDNVYFERKLRKKMAAAYENYTCMDFDLPTTEAIEESTWEDPKSGEIYNTHIMLDRPASMIHVIENFITDEECDAMEEAASPMLEKAVVANGAGGNEISPNRKALQAGITVPWRLEVEKHPITTISRRVYDYVNDAFGLEIDEHGQESLMSIQYKALDDPSLNAKYEDYDQYLPHCDGDCTGDPHQQGSRVATMVMYCTVPTKGGATNFRNAGVHVQPKARSAIYFSYYDVERGIMDTGLTEHSGCPVVEGEKKIVTQWVRYGVTKEVPWTAYNSLGILLSDAKVQDGIQVPNVNSMGDEF